MTEQRQALGSFIYSCLKSMKKKLNSYKKWLNDTKSLKNHNIKNASKITLKKTKHIYIWSNIYEKTTKNVPAE